MRLLNVGKVTALKLLDRINSSADVKRLSTDELPRLCQELREEIQATEAALEAEQEALAEETAREETAEAREGEKR